MKTHLNKSKKNTSVSNVNTTSLQENNNQPTFQFVDNRPEAIVQRKLQQMADYSSQSAFQFVDNRPEAIVQRKLQEKMRNNSQPKMIVQSPAIQLKKSDPVQLQLDETKIATMCNYLNGLGKSKLYAGDYKAAIKSCNGGEESDWKALKEEYIGLYGTKEQKEQYANTRTPDALMRNSQTREQKEETFLALIQSGRISMGKIDKRIEGIESDKGIGFSIRVTITGMSKYVIHAHMKSDGNIAPGRSPVHVKKTEGDDREMGHFLVTIQPQDYDKFVPSPATVLAFGN